MSSNPPSTSAGGVASPAALAAGAAATPGGAGGAGGEKVRAVSVVYDAYRVLLSEGNVKAFHFNPKEPVLEAASKVAQATGKNTQEYGLFYLPSAREPGKWLRNDFPLEFYDIAKINSQSDDVKLAWKNKSRPIRVLLSGGDTYTTVMVNDTMPVKALTEMIGMTVGFENSVVYEKVSSLDNVDILNPDQLLRDQGFVGDIICGLYSYVGAATTYGLYAQLPFHEGKLFRKKATTLRGLKSSLANWVRRWYVLRKNQFAYFKSREDDRPLGFVDLSQTKSVRRIKATETEIVKDIPPKYKNLCFGMETSERMHVFLVDSAEEIAAWIESLDFARRLFSHYELTESFERARNVARIQKAQMPSTGTAGISSSISAGDQRAFSTKDFRRSSTLPTLSLRLGVTPARASLKPEDAEFRLVRYNSLRKLGNAMEESVEYSVSKYDSTLSSTTEPEFDFEEFQVEAEEGFSLDFVGTKEIPSGPISLLTPEKFVPTLSFSPIKTPTLPPTPTVEPCTLPTVVPLVFSNMPRQAPQIPTFETAFSTEPCVTLSLPKPLPCSQPIIEKIVLAPITPLTRSNIPKRLPLLQIRPQEPPAPAPAPAPSTSTSSSSSTSDPSPPVSPTLPSSSASTTATPTEQAAASTPPVAATPPEKESSTPSPRSDSPRSDSPRSDSPRSAPSPPSGLSPRSNPALRPGPGDNLKAGGKPPGLPLNSQGAPAKPSRPLPNPALSPRSSPPVPQPPPSGDDEDVPAPARGTSPRRMIGRPPPNRPAPPRGRAGPLPTGVRPPSAGGAVLMRSSSEMLPALRPGIAPRPASPITSTSIVPPAVVDEAEAPTVPPQPSEELASSSSSSASSSGSPTTSLRSIDRNSMSGRQVLNQRVVKAAPMRGRRLTTIGATSSSASRAARSTTGFNVMRQRTTTTEPDSGGNRFRYSIDGSRASYSEAYFLSSLTLFINQALSGDIQDDSHLASLLPLQNDFLLPAIVDGAILARLLHHYFPGDFARGSSTAVDLAQFLAKVNQRFGEHLRTPPTTKDFDVCDTGVLMNLVSVLVRECFLSTISIARTPSLLLLADAILADAGEEHREEVMGRLVQLSPESLLSNWLNYHLGQSHGQPYSFQWDSRLPVERLASGEIYVRLLHSLSGGELFSDLEGSLASLTPSSLSAAIVRYTQDFPFLLVDEPHTLLGAGPEQMLRHLTCLAVLCLTNPFPKKVSELGALLKDSPSSFWSAESEPRPDHLYLDWVKSLDPSGSWSAPYHDRCDVVTQFSDGYLLLHSIAALARDPSYLRSSRGQPPQTPEEVQSFTDHFVAVARELQLQGASDFSAALLRAGNVQMALRMLESLRLYEIAHYQQIHQVDVMTEDGLLEWCNEIASQLGTAEIRSFGDSSLQSCVFFLNILQVVFPHVVKPAFITPGLSVQQSQLNARYFNYILTKIGLTPKRTWQQIYQGDNDTFLLLSMQIYVAASSLQDDS